MLAIIIGLLTMVVGFYMVYRPRFFVDFIGHQAWLEKIFQIYDDELAYKILGIIVIFVGAFISTGIIWDILGWALSPVINAGRRT